MKNTNVVSDNLITFFIEGPSGEVIEHRKKRHKRISSIMSLF